MAKLDLKVAYRSVPVHPDDRFLLGMRWGDSIFVDTAFLFGFTSAPKIFFGSGRRHTLGYVRQGRMSGCPLFG